MARLPGKGAPRGGNRLRLGRGRRAFAIGAALPLAVAGAAIACAGYVDQRAETIAARERLARTTAEDVRRFVADRLHVLRAVAAAPPVRAADHVGTSAYLADVDPRARGFPGGLSWIDRAGRLGAISAPGLPGAPAYDLGERDYVRAVLRTGRPFVAAGRATDGTETAPSVTMAVPGTDPSGQPTGVVAGTIRADALTPLLRGAPSGTAVHVLDRRGQVLADGASGPRGQAAAGDPARVERLRSRGAGVDRDVVGLDGRPGRLLAFAAVPSADWLVVVEEPMAAALRPARRQLAARLTAVFGLVALTGVGLRRRARRLVAAEDRARRVRDRQARLAAERAALHARAEAARSDPNGARERTRLLADVGAALDGAAETPVRMTALLDALVPRLADAAVVEHVGAGATDALLPPDLADPRPTFAVRALNSDREALLRELWRQGAAVGGLGGSQLTVPLRAHGRHCGSLVLMRTDGRGAAYSEDEADLARDIAARAGAALADARLHERIRHLGVGLQHALLPATLQVVDGVRVDACYRPPLRHAPVGGDWYDAFALPDGRQALVVGDVAGRGLVAAAVMGALRTAVRAVAVGSDGPRQVLQRLDSAIAGVEAARLATLVYVELEPVDGRLDYACAGHPPPLLLPPLAGPWFLEGGRSAPLGVPGVGREQASGMLPAGSTLLLYTDGLVARRNETVDVGQRRLARVAAERRSGTDAADAGTTGLVTAMLEGQPRHDDDACLLSVSRVAVPRPSGPEACPPAQRSGAPGPG